jgi:hypothetical protein
VIFHLNGERFDRWIKAGALWDRPTLENPIHFKPKIIVQPAGRMFLYDKE